MVEGVLAPENVGRSIALFYQVTPIAGTPLFFQYLRLHPHRIWPLLKRGCELCSMTVQPAELRVDVSAPAH